MRQSSKELGVRCEYRQDRYSAETIKLRDVRRNRERRVRRRAFHTFPALKHLRNSRMIALPTLQGHMAGPSGLIIRLWDKSTRSQTPMADMHCQRLGGERTGRAHVRCAASQERGKSAAEIPRICVGSFRYVRAPSQ